MFEVVHCIYVAHDIELCRLLRTSYVQSGSIKDEQIYSLV
jgi:hypothetical protein